ncbi:MAG: DUF3825 domain-containing protein [Thermoguttaceae bacterium]|nr:DUF3825 domain-containing protein [Thermoguttaceae bacterium]
MTKAPNAAAASSVPEKKSTVAVKTAIPASPSASPGVPANAPKKLSDAEVEKRVLAAVAALQTDENGVRDAAKWVDFANLGSPLKKKGVDGKAFGFSTFAKFLQARFAERLEFRNEGTRWRVRPKTANAPSTLDATQAPSSEPPKKFLPDAEVEKRVFAAIRELQTDADGKRDASAWVPFTRLGARLKEKGVDGKTAGFSSFAKFFETRFADQLEFDGDPNARRTRPKPASTAVVPVAKNGSTAQTSSKLSDAELEKRVFAALRALQKDDAGRRDAAKWVDFTVLGPRLKADGVDGKAFDCASYAKLLEARFSKTLQFDKSEPTAWRVRPTLAPNKDDANLADWAVVAPERFDELAKLALPEKRRFDDAEPAPGEPRFPILASYLKYTFRQLAFEEKVKIAPTEDVAAFNTGLFDRKFDPIFAFFRKNVGPEPQPWRLSSFAVAGENDGKELVARFAPLPERARFFERRDDLVFDGDAEIVLDAEHCLVERACRLPSEFLRRWTTPEFLALEIDGETRTLDDVADKPEKDPTRRRYFKALAKKLPESNALVRLKVAFEGAVELAKKRAVANPRTAVPTFNPTKRGVCLMLPLALIDPASNRSDVALVVERLAETGVYQAHTVYSLDMARQTASLTARLGGENWLDG